MLKPILDKDTLASKELIQNMEHGTDAFTLVSTLYSFEVFQIFLYYFVVSYFI